VEVDQAEQLSNLIRLSLAVLAFLDGKGKGGVLSAIDSMGAPRTHARHAGTLTKPTKLAKAQSGGMVAGLGEKLTTPFGHPLSFILTGTTHGTNSTSAGQRSIVQKRNWRA
jgi:hypothetical protein